jgi:hypothetical protein
MTGGAGFNLTNERLVWYTDVSKINEGTGAGAYGYCMRRKLHFSFGQYTWVFKCMPLTLVQLGTWVGTMKTHLYSIRQSSTN